MPLAARCGCSLHAGVLSDLVLAHSPHLLSMLVCVWDAGALSDLVIVLCFTIQ